MKLMDKQKRVELYLKISDTIDTINTYVYALESEIDRKVIHKSLSKITKHLHTMAVMDLFDTLNCLN